MSLLKIVSSLTVAAAIMSVASCPAKSNESEVQKYDLGNGIYIYGEGDPSEGEDLFNYSSEVGNDPGNGDGTLIE